MSRERIFLYRDWLFTAGDKSPQSRCVEHVHAHPCTTIDTHPSQTKDLESFLMWVCSCQSFECRRVWFWAYCSESLMSLWLLRSASCSQTTSVCVRGWVGVCVRLWVGETELVTPLIVTPLQVQLQAQLRSSASLCCCVIKGKQGRHAAALHVNRAHLMLMVQVTGNLMIPQSVYAAELASGSEHGTKACCFPFGLAGLGPQSVCRRGRNDEGVTWETLAVAWPVMWPLSWDLFLYVREETLYLLDATGDVFMRLCEQHAWFHSPLKIVFIL